MVHFLFKTAQLEGALAFDETNNRAAGAKQLMSRHGPIASIAWLGARILPFSSTA
jgi:hypothetical protein